MIDDITLQISIEVFSKIQERYYQRYNKIRKLGHRIMAEFK